MGCAVKVAGGVVPLTGIIEPHVLINGLCATIAAAITSGSSASFTLTLPSDSAFKTMTSATNMTVIQQTKTTISGASPIANGSTVHAFGLLFFDAGQWKMVASRIGSNQAVLAADDKLPTQSSLQT